MMVKDRKREIGLRRTVLEELQRKLNEDEKKLEETEKVRSFMIQNY